MLSHPYETVTDLFSPVEELGDSQYLGAFWLTAEGQDKDSLRRALEVEVKVCGI
jgi:hypothetical protein